MLLTFALDAAKTLMSSNPLTGLTQGGRRRAGAARSEPNIRGRYHHGDLRRALIDAALLLTLQRGPNAFTLTDLCRAVGVSSAAPYRHFESLDQLLSEAALEGFNELDARLARSFQGSDWRAKLASCVTHYLGFVRAQPARALLMFAARSQTVQEPDFNPYRTLDLPAPRSRTEAAVHACWRNGTAIFQRYAVALTHALAESPLAFAVSTRRRRVDTALALYTILQGIAGQWLARSLPDDWLDHAAKKSFDRIVLPWAIGLSQSARTKGRRRKT